MRAGDNEFHFHPHYRSETPLDSVLLQTRAGLDEFATEKEHDRVAAVLAEWSTSLLGTGKLQPAFAPDFLGASPQPAESRVVRPGPALEVRRIAFPAELSLASEAFDRELQAALGGYTKIVTAELQVTRIGIVPDGLQTLVRYELVGQSADAHREQRIGSWNLEWSAGPGEAYRVRRWHFMDEVRSRAAAPWFTDVTARAFGGNTSYTNQLLHGVDHWRTVLDGASGIDIYGHNGVSAGDLHGTGFDDLYVCQPAGLPNRLYRNNGNGTFEDVTERSGLGILENTACALIADFDNDGRQDIAVVRANGPLLFLNQGGGKFRRVPDAFQFAQPPQGTFTGAAAADYNRDGLLDIYFCLYVYYQGADQYKYPVPYYAAENGPPNFLMRNNGNGTFTDVTAAARVNVNNTRYSFCCGWQDYNHDGWPDLYVVNDFGRKNLYRNNGDGTFTDVAALAGVEDVGAGMGVSWLDYDNDGAEDLYVADMWSAAGERISMQDEFQKGAPQAVRGQYRKHAMGNSLFRNQDGAFQDATAAAQVGMGRWAWSSDSWDFDHDGFADLYIANGMVSGPVREDLNSFFWRRVVAQSPNDARPSVDYEQGWSAVNELIRSDYTWSGYERNVFYANNCDGTFSDVSGVVGLDFLEDGRAFALADIDHDGRLEVVLKNRNVPQLRLLKNVVEGLPPSIAFQLRGTKSNRDAIGTVVTVETTSMRQSRTLSAGSGFLSQHTKELFFGLGADSGPVKASIRWPSGLSQEFHNLPPGHRIHVEEGTETLRVEAFVSSTLSQSVAQQPAAREENVETWLLAPVAAPDSAGTRGKPVLLTLSDAAPIETRPSGVLQLRHIRIGESPDQAAVYNIVYRYLFDRHRDLTLPTSFLIDEHGDIVKVYQGPVNPSHAEEDARNVPRTTAERLARALPFRGNAETYEFGRNNLSFGSVFFQRGYFDQAEGAFRLALRDDPASAEAQYGIGSVYLKQDKTREARESFENAIKLTASYPDTLPNAWNNLGLLDTRENRMDEAVGCFQEALRVSPEYWIALLNLGIAYRFTRRWDEARAALERALAARPRDPEATYNLAMVFAQTGESERAYEYFRRALTTRPTYPEALNNLGVLYLRTHRRDEAVAAFKECIRVAPAFDQAYLNLAQVYQLEGAPEKARVILQDLLKQHPGHAQALQALEQLH